MQNKDYENKRRECWEEYKEENLDGEVQWQPVSRYDVFCAAFDRAYALGKQETKQETDSEDTVIQGWVCRDKYWQKDIFPSNLFLAMEKPKRNEEWKTWTDMGGYISLNIELFPDLTWESDPEPIEITIKRKKK